MQTCSISLQNLCEGNYYLIQYLLNSHLSRIFVFWLLIFSPIVVNAVLKSLCPYCLLSYTHNSVSVPKLARMRYFQPWQVYRQPAQWVYSCTDSHLCQPHTAHCTQGIVRQLLSVPQCARTQHCKILDALLLLESNKYFSKNLELRNTIKLQYQKIILVL